MFGFSYAPAVFLGALIIGLWVSPLPISTLALSVFALTVAVGYTAVAAVLRYILPSRLEVRRFGDVGWFVLVSLGVPLLTAAMATAELALAGVLHWSDYFSDFLKFWVGDAIGIVTLTPFLLVNALPLFRSRKESAIFPGPPVEGVRGPGWQWPDRGWVLGALVKTMSIALVLWVVFGWPVTRGLHLFYLSFFPLMWIALRHGLAGSTAGVLATHVGAMLAVRAFGLGPHHVPELQVLMLAMSLGVLFLGVVVTERKRAEDALGESGRFLQSTLNALSSNIAVLDESGTIVAVNAAWQRASKVHHFVGATHGTGTNYLQVCDSASGDSAEPAAAIAKGIREVMINQRDEFFLEYPCHSLEGKRWTVAHVTRFKGAGPVRVVVSHEDITERALAEEALRRSEEQLRQAQKMEAVGRLAGGVAHDFNNLLTVITGRSQLLLSRLPSGDRLRRDIALVQQAAERAAGLTRQLLAFSRKQVLEPKVLDLNAVVTNIGNMLRRLIGEDIHVVTDLAPRLGRVQADPGQLEQVIVNLAVNARDAMPDGGRLTIETASVELDGDFARRHPGASAGPHVMLAVADTGIGMDAVTLSQIFEPFFTTKERGRGTGLGLSTVYGIVQQHHGFIVVESKPGQGTTFKIYLPSVEGAVEVVETRGALTGSPRGSETVLLVEDEDEVRALAREVLEVNGYAVLEAANGGGALQISQRHPGPIHALLTDVVMPQISGKELAQRLSLLRPDLKVLYMSGYTGDGVLEPGRAFLQKPFTPEALASKLRDLLDTPRDELVVTGGGEAEGGSRHAESSVSAVRS
jgi:signal transduction histidine kinase/integral membrane sensor domain MASE1